MKLKLALASVAAAGLLMVFGLSGGASSLSLASVERSQPFYLDRHIGEPFQRYCVIGPYSTNNMAREITGREIDVDGESSIGTNDSIALIAVIQSDTSELLYEVPRQPVDFTRLHGECFTPGTQFVTPSEGHPFASLHTSTVAE